MADATLFRQALTLVTLMLGIDMLGGPKYASQAADAYRRLRQTVSDKYAIGVFWKEFGNAGDFIDRLHKAGCKVFRVHIRVR